MKKLSRISLLAALSIATAMCSGAAVAGHVSVGIYAGAPAPYYYAPPPPVYYAPQPYYAPAPVYVGPRWEHTDWRERREWRERQRRHEYWEHRHGHDRGYR